MITSLIFDMGRVLIEFNPEKFIRLLGYTDKNEIDYINNHVFLSDTWKDMDAGRITSEEGQQIMILSVADRYKKDVRRLVSQWWSLLGPIEGMPAFIRLLWEKGYHLYLLSNAADDHSFYWNQLPYKDYFEGLYISALHKKMKPGREIYEDCLQVFGLQKEECMFFDDLRENVDAANAFGIKSHQFISKDELTAYLAKCKII